ncbi:MAG: hypothetical protein ACJAS1_007125 [Oleiphilaceae bacterium]|jgi:hypothetical protein
MELLEKLPIIEIHPIGEFRMGAMGYGLSIHTVYGTYDFLKDIPTLIGSTNYDSAVEISEDQRYFKVSGPDITYILDSKNMKASIYRITVRAVSEKEQYAWSESAVYSSEENCVFGKNTEHINGFHRHVYLQCQWVVQDEILSLVSKYKNLREDQLKVAGNAL